MFIRSIVYHLGLVFGITCLVSGSAQAHDLNSAVIDLRQLTDQGYVLQIKTPLYHLDMAMRQSEPGADTIKFGTDHYKEAIVRYLKTNISIGSTEASNQMVGFGRSAIKLNDHQTDIIIELDPGTLLENSLQVRIPIMNHNPKQTNVFRVFRDDQIEKILLNNQNGFSDRITLGGK